MTLWSRRWAGHSVSRAIEASGRMPRPVAVLAIGMALGLAYLLTYAAGGTRTVLPHLFYVPVVVAAVRGRWPDATLTALAAGVLAGPLMPADVAAGTAQSPANWLGRTVAFLVVANLVTWLVRQSHASLLESLADHRMAAALRAAVTDGRIVVHYQPVVELGSGRVVGLEALCRWEHPTGGLVPPGDFIPVAERTGVIHDVGRHVLATALGQLRRWQAVDPDLSVSVNVSAQELRDPRLVDDVRTALAAAGVAADRLHLEITETAVIGDPRSAVAQVKALRALGVRIAVDDFGAGESSLGYLHQFDVDIVKVDRRFARELVADPKCTRLLGGILRLVESIGAVTLVEGVESESQLQVLRRLGCRYAQGYHLGRPAPADRVTERLPRELGAGRSRHHR